MINIIKYIINTELSAFALNKQDFFMFSAYALQLKFPKRRQRSEILRFMSECGHGGDSVTPPGFPLISGHARGYSTEQKEFIVLVCLPNFLHILNISM